MGVRIVADHIPVLLRLAVSSLTSGDLQSCFSEDQVQSSFFTFWLKCFLWLLLNGHSPAAGRRRGPFRTLGGTVAALDLRPWFMSFALASREKKEMDFSMLASFP